ncbi:MAG: site-2 protease family protein [Anaerolineae bacterium]|nr:MAG: site-2 protease family protein [Anaerolineae bacterium]
MTFLIVLLGWVFSLSLHEFSHALVAYLGGDWTVREKGYLTFNPFKYTHPVYSLLLPLLFLIMGGIGLPGGAVYIETWRLRSRRWRSAVSLAGPLSNLLLGGLLALLLRFAPATSGGIWPALAFLALLQIMAAVLNLIPLPPLDGYGALAPYLSPDLQARLGQIGGAGIWILFLLLWYVPFVDKVFWGLVFWLAGNIGIPLTLAGQGLAEFQFWRRW